MKFGNIDEGIKVFDKPITAIKGIIDELKSYNSVLSESTDLQKSHIDVVTQQNSSLGNYLSGLNGAEASLGGYAKSLVKSKIASIGLQAASIALNAAITMGVSIGISLLTSQIIKMIRAKEDARKKTLELTNTYKEEQETLDGQIAKYKELKTKLDNENLSADESRSIKEQLLGIQESLVDLYGEEASNLDLVNGKYREQLGLLGQLTKEKATEYVIENRDTFEDAKKALEKERTFKFHSESWMGFNLPTEDQEKTLDYFENYSDLIKVENNPLKSPEDQIITKIVSIKADTESADKLMHQLAIDLEAWGKENSIDVSIPLNNISAQLRNTWTDELQEYKTIYDEFMKAEVIRNDTLRPLYDQSIQAVEDYNAALSSGEGIEEAKANLDSIQQSVSEATGELEGSQGVFDNIYGYINKDAEAAYNLSNAFQDDEVKSYAEQLRGLSDIDLKAIKFDNKNLEKGEQAFKALLGYLGMTEEEAGFVIDKLVELGYVQGEIKETVENTETSTPLGFTISDDQSKALDAYQSMVSTINDAMEKLAIGSLSASEALDLIQFIMSTDPKFDLMMYRAADGTINLTKALEHLENTTMQQLIAQHPELESEILALHDTLETVTSKINRLTNEYYEVVDVLDKMKRGVALTAVEAAELINKHSELAGAVQLTAEGIYFENDALTDLANQCSKTANDSIAAAIVQTKGIIEETKKRISVYEIEAQAQQDLLNSVASPKLDPNASVEENSKLLEQSQSGLLSEYKNQVIETHQNLIWLHQKKEQEEINLTGYIDQLDRVLNTDNKYLIGGSKSPGKSTAKEFSGSIDLISESITTLTEKISLMEAELENITDPTERLKQLKAIEAEEKNLITAYQKGEAKYKKQYESLKKGLPQEYIDAIENGTTYKIKKLKGEDGEKLYNQFQEAAEAHRNEQAMAKGAEEATNKWAKSLDWAAEEINNITSELAMFESMLDNSESYKNIIKYCDIIIDKQKELRDSTEDLLGVREKEYEESLKLLTPEQRKAVESNDLEKIESWKGRVGEEKYNRVTDALEKKRKRDEARSNLHKEHETWQNSYLDKANRVGQWYDYRTDNIDTRKDAIQNEINMREASGLAVPAAYYEKIADLERNKLDYLKRKQEDINKILKDGMASGAIAEYSPEWYALTGQIQDTNLAIQDCQSNIIDMNNAVRDLKWDNFDKLMDKLEAINEEADFLIDLMSHADLIDDNGKYTEEGLATLAMHRTKYQTKQDEAKKYKAEADSLADATDEDSIRRREELLALQRECISAAEAEKQAMIELAQEGIQKQIDNMGELIDKKKEALQAERELQEYRESIAEKQKKVTDIEKALVALSGDDSEEAKKKKRQLRAELADAKKDLEDTERDHAYDEENKALDNLLEIYTTNMEAVMNDTETLFQNTMETVDNASETVGNTIQKVAKEAGYEITSNITNIWKDSATEAANSATVFESVGKRLTGVIDGITLKWAEVQAAAEKAGEAQLKAMNSDHMSSGTEDGSMKTTIENFLKDSANYSSKLVTSKSDENYAGLSSLNKSLVDAGYGNLSYQGMAALANLLKINGVQTHTAASVSKDSSVKKMLEQSLKDYGIFGGTKPSNSSSASTPRPGSSTSKPTSNSSTSKTDNKTSSNYKTETKPFTNEYIAPLGQIKTDSFSSFIDPELEAFLKNSANYSSTRITSSSDEGYSKLSSLNKKLINGGYGNLSYNGMAGLANLLQLNGRTNYTSTELQTDTNLKTLLEEELTKRKIPGFSTGGIVKSVTGEDGFLLAQKGEAILSKEAVSALQNFTTLATNLYPHILDLSSRQQPIPRDMGSHMVVSDNPVQIHIDHVENMEDFLHKMQDEQTQKLLQEAIWSPVMGKGTMGIYKF